jgi:hypothetical protein
MVTCIAQLIFPVEAFNRNIPGIPVVGNQVVQEFFGRDTESEEHQYEACLQTTYDY